MQALAVTGELTEGTRRALGAIWTTPPTPCAPSMRESMAVSKLNDLLMQFDYPDANVHAEKRSATTTPTQKLFLLNSPLSCKSGLVAKWQRACRRSRAPNEEQVTAAYRLLFAREPDSTERAVALNFLRKPGTAAIPQWERYAQLLLASNEMLYVD